MGLLDDRISFLMFLSISESAMIKPSEFEIAFLASAEKSGDSRPFVNAVSIPSKERFLIKSEERGSENGVPKKEETILVLAKMGSSI